MRTFIALEENSLACNYACSNFAPEKFEPRQCIEKFPEKFSPTFIWHICMQRYFPAK